MLELDTQLWCPHISAGLGRALTSLEPLEVITDVPGLQASQHLQDAMGAIYEIHRFRTPSDDWAPATAGLASASRYLRNAEKRFLGGQYDGAAEWVSHAMNALYEVQAQVNRIGCTVPQ